MPVGWMPEKITGAEESGDGDGVVVVDVDAARRWRCRIWPVTGRSRGIICFMITVIEQDRIS